MDVSVFPAGLPAVRLSAARHCALAVVMLALAACATSQPAKPPPGSLTTATPQQQVAAIRAAAGDGEGELAIQPLRDPKVEDLRAKAARLETQQYYAEAARTLDQALEIVPDDPALLQERAEAALLLGDHARAEALARRAFTTGSQVGPLCRRHWATIRQSRLLEGDAAGAAAAKKQVDQCTVAGVNRF